MTQLRPDYERRLWNRLHEEAEGGTDHMVRLAEIGCSELPTHKEQITNIIASWRNRGLVRTNNGDTRVVLTESGRRVEDPT